MKEVMLKITGKHIYDTTEEDQLELVTEGKLYNRGNSIYLTYDEGELSGMEGLKTRLSLKGDVVKMTRKGSAVGIDTELRFEKGRRYSGLYDTPYGPIEMEVVTNQLENSVTADGEGTINIDYSIALKGFSEGRAKLNIEVKERQ